MSDTSMGHGDEPGYNPETAAEQAFTSWWRYPDARLGPEAANRRGFLAGHASRDAEVAALQADIERLKDILAAFTQRPIPVSERLPERDKQFDNLNVSADVLATDGMDWFVCFLDHTDGYWHNDDRLYSNVTHWIHLPPPLGDAT